MTPTQAARTLGVHYSAATKYLNQLTELELVEASELVKHHLHSNRQFITFIWPRLKCNVDFVSLRVNDPRAD